jgi:hypothetical protein
MSDGGLRRPTRNASSGRGAARDRLRPFPALSRLRQIDIGPWWRLEPSPRFSSAIRRQRRELPSMATHADPAPCSACGAATRPPGDGDTRRHGPRPVSLRRKATLGVAPPDTRDGAEAPRHAGTRACGSQRCCRCLRPSSTLHPGRCSSEHVAAALLGPRPARLLVATSARRTSPAVDGGSRGPRPAHDAALQQRTS